MGDFRGNPFSRYMPSGGSNANASTAPLSLYELMTGQSPDQSQTGQIPSGPGQYNQGANWMPPQGSMGDPQSQAMPSQGASMGKNPQPQSGVGTQGLGGQPSGTPGTTGAGQQWNGWLPRMPGTGPAMGGSPLFGPPGVANGGQAGGIMGKMGQMGGKGGAVGP